MKFWKKKPAAIQPEKKPEPVQISKDGFFNTSPMYSDESIQQRVHNAINRSIQIKPEKLKPVDENGNAVAMDNSIQEVKMQASTMGYLPIQQVEWYGSQGFIGWQMCAIMSQNWLVDKCCTLPAKDAVRNGWEISVNDGDEISPEIFDELRRYEKKMQVKKNCIEFIRMGKVFGIRHALFLVDGIDYELPFNIDGVKPGAYRGITQIDPYWIAPELDRTAAANTSAQDFYEPTWWRVNGKRVHRSHFVIMRNGDNVPDMLKPSYIYGGIPTPQKIYERVYASERTANEAPLLAMTKRMVTLKIDTAQALLDPVMFAQKMQEWSQLMNNFGIKVIGGDEELSQLDTSLAGLDETIMTQYQLVAAAANVPATKLLGTSPKGFNATGEYEESSYHEELESIQETEISPLIERHNQLAIKSYIEPKFGKTFNFEVQFNPLNAMTAEELADVNLKKAQADTAWAAAGAIDGVDIRQKLIKDRDSGYNGISEEVEGMEPDMGDPEGLELVNAETADEA